MNLLARSTLPTLALFTLLAGSAVAQTTVTLVSGHLTLTTDARPQDVKVEVKEAPGIARVFGFAGIADGTAYSGVSSITVNTGSPADKFKFDVDSSQSLSIFINSGFGPMEALVEWQVKPSAAPVNASVSINTLSSSLSKAVVLFKNEANDALIVIDTGNSSEVSSKVVSSNPTASLGVVYAGRGPKTSVEVESAAAGLAVDLGGTYSGVPSEVKHVVSQKEPGTVNISSNVDLGNGSDFFETKVSAPGSDVTITGLTRAGDGTNFVLFELEGFRVVNGLRLEGGRASDFLSMTTKGRFQLSQTLGTSIFGGNGNDILILRAPDGIYGSGLPNDVLPLIDGGDGFDLHDAFGQIINVEGRL